MAGSRDSSGRLSTESMAGTIEPGHSQAGLEPILHRDQVFILWSWHVDFLSMASPPLSTDENLKVLAPYKTAQRFISFCA